MIWMVITAFMQYCISAVRPTYLVALIPVPVSRLCTLIPASCSIVLRTRFPWLVVISPPTLGLTARVNSSWHAPPCLPFSSPWLLQASRVLLHDATIWRPRLAKIPCPWHRQRTPPSVNKAGCHLQWSVPFDSQILKHLLWVYQRTALDPVINCSLLVIMISCLIYC